MKTKLFIVALATLAVVGCNKENEVVSPQDGQTSLISVSLKAAGTMTKAPEDAFVYGSDDENAVKNAVFYFFDASGNPYALEGQTNYLEVSSMALTQNENEPVESIEEVSDVVLVLKGQTQAPPAQMVALINVTASEYKNKTLCELESVSTDFVTKSDKNYFVMSNSVYEGNQGVVTATQILPENVFTDPDPDVNVGETYTGNVKPVVIYVERVAAKVRVKVTRTANEAGVYPVDGDDDTYVKVCGWDVTNATNTSHLIKNYAETELFTPFNSADFHRSYWAKTHEDAEAVHGFKFTDITKKLGSEAYYHENTLQTTAVADGWVNDVDVDGDNTNGMQAPQLIVAAQLCDAEGKPKAMGSWYGVTYDDVDGLMATMISNAAKQIFVASETDAQVKVGIDVDDVEFYQVDDQTSYNDSGWNGDYRYEVRVKAKSAVTYYDATGTVMTEAAVNAILSQIEPARIWTLGYTYYYALISHFGDAKAMVRNHLYDVNITGFKGFGTPVYEPNMIITPETPVDPEAYHLAAQINVLSWHVVSNNVELGF